MAARAMAKPKESGKKLVPLEERIRERAHEIYLQRGGQDGSEINDWLQAEAEIRQEQGAGTEVRPGI